jgi:hypothetical protein
MLRPPIASWLALALWPDPFAENTPTRKKANSFHKGRSNEQFISEPGWQRSPKATQAI